MFVCACVCVCVCVTIRGLFENHLGLTELCVSLVCVCVCVCVCVLTQ